MIIKPNHHNTSEEQTTVYDDANSSDMRLLSVCIPHGYHTGEICREADVYTTHMLNRDIKLRVHPIFLIINYSLQAQ